jgi:hypothetical protein
MFGYSVFITCSFSMVEMSRLESCVLAATCPNCCDVLSIAQWPFYFQVFFQSWFTAAFHSSNSRTLFCRSIQCHYANVVRTTQPVDMATPLKNVINHTSLKISGMRLPTFANCARQLLMTMEDTTSAWRLLVITVVIFSTNQIEFRAPNWM